MKFILIENRNITEDILSFIIGFIGGKNIRLIETSEYLTLFHNYENNDDLNYFLKALAIEYMISLKAYISGDLKNTTNNLEIKMVKDLLINAPNDVYRLKNLMLSTKFIEKREDKLKLILSSTGITPEIIKCLAEHNFNISESSNILYLHRNTLNYRIDKLLALTGFDLKLFKDQYLLYNLIESKN